MSKLTGGSWMSVVAVGLLTAACAPQLAWAMVASAALGACFASWKWPWL